MLQKYKLMEQSLTRQKASLKQKVCSLLTPSVAETYCSSLAAQQSIQFCHFLTLFRHLALAGFFVVHFNWRNSRVLDLKNAILPSTSRTFLALRFLNARFRT
jgi:hypothetical protein